MFKVKICKLINWEEEIPIFNIHIPLWDWARAMSVSFSDVGVQLCRSIRLRWSRKSLGDPSLIHWSLFHQMAFWPNSSGQCYLWCSSHIRENVWEYTCQNKSVLLIFVLLFFFVLVLYINWNNCDNKYKYTINAWYSTF